MVVVVVVRYFVNQAPVLMLVCRITAYDAAHLLLHSGAGGCMQVCTSLQTDNHASTPPLSFYRSDALPAAQATVSKH